MIDQFKIFNLKFKIPAKQGGFSLVELLIVITIIGVLSTIILNSLSNARSRAYDSKVKQQLSNFRTAAEVYFQNQDPNGYGPASASCDTGITLFTNVTVSNGTPGIYIAAGNLPDFAVPVCQASLSAYAVKAPLYSGNEYWCVDSKGFSGVVPGAITGPTTICP